MLLFFSRDTALLWTYINCKAPDWLCSCPINGTPIVCRGLRVTLQCLTEHFQSARAVSHPLCWNPLCTPSKINLRSNPFTARFLFFRSFRHTAWISRQRVWNTCIKSPLETAGGAMFASKKQEDEFPDAIVLTFI